MHRKIKFSGRWKVFEDDHWIDRKHGVRAAQFIRKYVSSPTQASVSSDRGTVYVRCLARATIYRCLACFFFYPWRVEVYRHELKYWKHFHQHFHPRSTREPPSEKKIENTIPARENSSPKILFRLPPVSQQFSLLKNANLGKVVCVIVGTAKILRRRDILPAPRSRGRRITIFSPRNFYIPFVLSTSAEQIYYARLSSFVRFYNLFARQKDSGIYIANMIFKIQTGRAGANFAWISKLCFRRVEIISGVLCDFCLINSAPNWNNSDWRWFMGETRPRGFLNETFVAPRRGIVMVVLLPFPEFQNFRARARDILKWTPAPGRSNNAFSSDSPVTNQLLTRNFKRQLTLTKQSRPNCLLNIAARLNCRYGQPSDMIISVSK